MSEHAIAVGNAFPWHELYTNNHAAAMKFYGDVLGWTTQAMPMPGDAPGEYTMFVRNGTPICGTMDTTAMEGMEHVPPHWSVFIGVDDVDGCVSRCEAGGGTVVVPIMDIPTIGRMSLLKDPQGATFWVYKSENPS